jgi:dihydrofolate reductase
MPNIISFMHLSLDGFVAGPNGEMDWITVNDEIFDYVGTRIAKSDAALYGRVTYQMMENYWPTAGDKPNASKHDIQHAKWYKSIRKIVLSRSLQSESGDTSVIGDALVEQMQALKQGSVSNKEEILLFGSPGATHSLMEHKLIDGYWLFLNPVILGKGIPLFKNVPDKVKLEMLPASKTFDCGVRELNYRVKEYI